MTKRAALGSSVAALAVAAVLVVIFSRSTSRAPVVVTASAPSAADSAAAAPSLGSPPTDAERSVVPATNQLSESLRVDVVDESGSPLAFGRIRLFDPDWREGSTTNHPAFPRAETDALGRAVFASPPRELRGVLVSFDDQPPVQSILPEARGDVRVVVPSEIVLAGFVFVDGAPAPAGVPIEIRGLIDPTLDWSPAARLVLASLRFDGSALRAVTDSDGSFAIRGVPVGEEVIVRAPDRFRDVDGGAPESREVTGDLAVMLELIALPIVRVRAVERPGTEAPRALTIDCVFGSVGGHARRTSIDAQLGQPVEIPLEAADAAVAVDVRARHRPEVLARSHARLPREGELSIVVPDSAVACRMQVVDEHGKPLAGARAALGGRSFGPSCADGWLDLQRIAGVDDATVLAPAHTSRRVELTQADPCTLTVALRPANRLELEVVASDSNRIRLERLGARIERETSATHVGPGFDPTGPPFAGWEPVPWPLARHFPEEAVHLDANGRWTCVDLPVDVKLRVSVCDSRGATIASDTVTIGIEESRRVAFRIEREPLSVAGRVVDVDGRPIPGARLHIERHLFCIAQADADGRFALDDLFDADAELKISAEGFADVRLRAADAADQRVFVLEPARTMWVEVRSMSEATDAPGLRLELQGGGQLDGNRVELGLYRFDGVPRRVGWLRCERSGDGMRVAPDETRVRFVVDP